MKRNRLPLTIRIQNTYTSRQKRAVAKAQKCRRFKNKIKSVILKCGRVAKRIYNVSKKAAKDDVGKVLVRDGIKQIPDIYKKETGKIKNHGI